MTLNQFQYSLEGILEKHEIDVEYYALEIRKLAAAHQSGMSLRDAKCSVDLLIQILKERMGPDKNIQAKVWNEFLEALDRYINGMADPAWLKVIAHARYRAKSRRYSAIHYRRHFRI